MFGELFGVGGQIGVDDLRAVERHFDMVALADDVHLLPLARLLRDARLRRDDIVQAAGVLGRLEVGVLCVVIVEDLDFHAGKGRIALMRSAEEDPAIAAGGHAVFQLQLEIGVLLVR